MRNEGAGLREIRGLMPDTVMNDIERICILSGLSLACVNEIRLSAISLSSIVLKGRLTALSVRLGYEELGAILRRACDMAVFAHRDEISEGYISLKCGGRVGVCGHARYEGGRLVGISEVSALVFRIPSGKCDFADKLHSFWRDRGYSGMLICSRAGVGKTTAIRALAAMAGDVKAGKRVVVVDERCELNMGAYRNCSVDILRGYRRSVGVEIAIRTMSADIVIVDEIGNEEDSDALMLAQGAGVSLLATAHGDDIRAIYKKRAIGRLIDAQLFSCYSVITASRGVRTLALGDISDVI